MGGDLSESDPVVGQVIAEPCGRVTALGLDRPEARRLADLLRRAADASEAMTAAPEALQPTAGRA